MNTLLSSLKTLFSLLTVKRRWQLLLVIFATLIGAVAEFASLAAVIPFLAILADPQRVGSYPVFSALVGHFQLGGMDAVWLSVLLFSATVLFAGVYRVFLLSLGLRFSFAVGHELGKNLYERVLHKPYAYHINTNSSEVLAGLQKVDTVIGWSLIPLIQGTVAAFFSMAIVVALLWVDWLLAMTSIAGFVGIYFLIGRITAPVLAKSGQQTADAIAEKIRATQEGLGGIRDVLIDGTQATFVRRFAYADGLGREAQRKGAVYSTAPRYLVEMAGMIVIALVALYVAQRPGGIAAALPILGALAMGAQRLLPQIQALYHSWASFVGSQSALIDVAGYLRESGNSVGASAQVTLCDLSGDIQLRGVGFRYAQDGPWIFRGIDLHLKQGQRIGFVGPTGGGKTTLVDIIMGLLAPCEGEVVVGGGKLRPETMRAWQDRISHVPQMIYLADATIAENIAFGIPKGQASLDRIRRAAAQAQIDQFIESLPMGYNTEIGERGVRLSGGQRQRIGLARALYKDISLLILDEATSALDDETERQVMEAVYALGRDITVLMIAHRTSTLEKCDEIYQVSQSGVRSQSDTLSIFGVATRAVL